MYTQNLQWTVFSSSALFLEIEVHKFMILKALQKHFVLLMAIVWLFDSAWGRIYAWQIVGLSFPNTQWLTCYSIKGLLNIRVSY